MKNYDELYQIQNKAETAKMRLIELRYELEEKGFKRQANSLDTIIEKLEKWQNNRTNGGR